MSEQACHEFGADIGQERRWKVMLPGNRSTYMHFRHGYCPTCGTRLNADGSTTPMVPAVASAEVRTTEFMRLLTICDGGEVGVFAAEWEHIARLIRLGLVSAREVRTHVRHLTLTDQGRTILAALQQPWQAAAVAKKLADVLVTHGRVECPALLFREVMGDEWPCPQGMTDERDMLRDCPRNAEDCWAEWALSAVGASPVPAAAPTGEPRYSVGVDVAPGGDREVWVLARRLPDGRIAIIATGEFPPTGEPSDTQLREPVRWFAERMEERLRVHDAYRGTMGWRTDCSDEFLTRRLGESIRDLTFQLGFAKSAAPVVKECVDVANFAMMLADRALFAGGQEAGHAE